MTATLIYMNPWEWSLKEATKVTTQLEAKKEMCQSQERSRNDTKSLK